MVSSVLTMSVCAVPLDVVIASQTKMLASVNNPVRVAKQDIVISKKTGLRLYQGKPYTGDVVVYYPSGEIAKLSNYQSGLRHGF